MGDNMRTAVEKALEELVDVSSGRCEMVFITGTGAKR